MPKAPSSPKSSSSGKPTLTVVRGQLNAAYQPTERAAAKQILYDLSDPRKRQGIITSAVGSLFEAYMIAAFTDYDYVTVMESGRLEFTAADEALNTLFANDAAGLNAIHQRLKVVAKDAVEKDINIPLKAKVEQIIAAELSKGGNKATVINELAGGGLSGSTAKGDIFFEEVVLELKYTSTPSMKWLTTSLEQVFTGGTPFKDYLETTSAWHNWQTYKDNPSGDTAWARAVTGTTFRQYYSLFAPNTPADVKATINFILSKNQGNQTNKRVVVASKVEKKGSRAWVTLTLDIDALMQKVMAAQTATLDINKYQLDGTTVMTVTADEAFNDKVDNAAKGNKEFPSTTDIRFVFSAYALSKM